MADRARAQNEAVWLSRYLGSTKGDYQKAVAELRVEKPISPRFLNDWREASPTEKQKGIIALRTKKEYLGTLVILDNYLLDWQPESNP